MAAACLSGWYQKGVRLPRGAEQRESFNHGYLFPQPARREYVFSSCAFVDPYVLVFECFLVTRMLLFTVYPFQMFLTEVNHHVLKNGP